MLKLWARESLPDKFPLLGTVLPPQKAEKQVCLYQKIVIPDAGHFTQKRVLPLMNDRELAQYLGENEDTSTQEKCAGVVLPIKRGGPVGQVCYAEGCYEYRMPVYSPEKVDNSWASRGYLPLEGGGYVIAAGKRHLAAKILLALLLAAVVAVVYCIGAYGRETVWQVVSTTAKGWYDVATTFFKNL